MSGGEKSHDVAALTAAMSDALEYLDQQGQEREDARIRELVRDTLNVVWVAADLPHVQVLRELVNERDRRTRSDEQAMPPAFVGDRSQERSSEGWPPDELVQSLADRVSLRVRDFVRDAVVDELRRHAVSTSARDLAGSHSAPAAGSPAKNAPAAGGLSNPESEEA